MRPADAGLSPKDKASIKMHAIVFQGHLPRMLWKFNNIIEAPEYVHSVGRDISLYNWYRNSITGILRGGAQVISTLVAKLALVKCPRMTARSTDQPTAESIA